MSEQVPVQPRPTQDIPPCPRTLILDFRDSYTANILTLFSTLYPPKPSAIPDDLAQNVHGVAKPENAESIADKVVIVQADTLDLSTYLALLRDKEIDCVILSPGPGRADCEAVGSLLTREPLPTLTSSVPGRAESDADHRGDAYSNIGRVSGNASDCGALWCEGEPRYRGYR